MKLSTANLKNVDFKQLAIDHGEKAVVVLIGLFVAWALYGTNWVPFDKTPDELATKADDTWEQVKDQAWPEADKEKFQPKINLTENVDRMLSEVNAGRYNFGAPFFWPLHPQKEPISEPAWVAVEDLLADASQVLVPMKPDPASLPIAAAEKPEEKKSEEGSSEFAPRRGRSPGGSGTRPGRTPVFSGFNRADEEDAELGRKFREEQRLQRTQRRRGRKRDDERGPGMISMEKGKGFRFVAVRGVYPLHQQIQELRKSLHIDTVNTLELLKKIKIYDFELQRQTAVRGASDPWSGPWEPVDISVASMVLNEAAEWEDDTLALGVTSSTITAPLPYRAVGEWGELASHHKLKNFELTDAEIDAQIKISEKLLEKMRAEKAKEAPKRTPQGFNVLQDDPREQLLASRNATGREAELESLIKELGKDIDDKEQRKKLEEMIRSREKNPEGNLLLFRYLDFDVQQGYTYRYRVRLTLLNPFYGFPPEDVVSPEVAEGEFRHTEWSKETTPVTIPEDTDYFVARIESDRPGVIPNARLDLFQWSPDSGTIVNSELKTLVGQYVAGKVKTHVLRPVPETFEREDFLFATDDVLVDVTERPALDRSLLSDLEIPQSTKEIPGLADQVLVMNRFGELVSVNPSNRSDLREAVASRFNDQNRFWEDIKDALVNAVTDGPGRGKRDDDDEGGSFGTGPSDNPRRRNSRRN